MYSQWIWSPVSWYLSHSSIWGNREWRAKGKFNWCSIRPARGLQLPPLLQLIQLTPQPPMHAASQTMLVLSFQPPDISNFSPNFQLKHCILTWKVWWKSPNIRQKEEKGGEERTDQCFNTVSLSELFRNFCFWWETLVGVIIWSVTISVLSRFLYMIAPYVEVLQFSNNIHSGWMQPCKLLLHYNCDCNFNRNLEASNFGRFTVGGAQEHKKISSAWGGQLLGKQGALKRS